MDKYIYKTLEIIGDAWQWSFDFVDSHTVEVTWFVIGVISILAIQFIF